MVAAALVLAGLLSSVPAVDGSPEVLEPVEVGVRGVIVRSGGRVVWGKVLRVGGGLVTVRRDGDDAIVTFPDLGVLGVVRERVPEGRLGGRTQVRAILTDGRVLAADSAVREGDELVLLTGAERRTLPTSSLVALVTTREERDPIVLQDLHLEAPAAVLPPPGALVVSSRLLAHDVLTAGLLPWLTLTAGTGLPVLHAGRQAWNAQLGLRAGRPLRPWLHAAAGLHGDIAAGGPVVTASATVTVGTPAARLTLHAGPLFPGADAFAARAGTVGVALAGALRLGPWLDGLAEGWLTSRGGERSSLAIAALRARFARLGVDVGAGRSFPDGKFVPWLGLHLDVERGRRR